MLNTLLAHPFKHERRNAFIKMQRKQLYPHKNLWKKKTPKTILTVGLMSLPPWSAIAA